MRRERAGDICEVNGEYNHLFAFIITACFVIGGVYVPNIFLLQQSYCGNTVMVTFLGYILYFLIANPVLVIIWFLVYYFKIANLSDKKRKEGFANDINVWRSGFEYKYSLLTWFVSTTLAYILQLSFYIYISVGIPSSSGVISIGDPTSVIGITGKDEYYDDLFQSTNLVCLVLYLLAFKYFVSIIYSIMAAASKKM